ncbi:flavodoxin family protein [Deferribacterales bacterium RsTz2092]|nr:FMN reductase [Deferribacterales bacterium]
MSNALKVVAINGSPRSNGNTARALRVMTDELEVAGIATETVHIGNKSIAGCLACGACANTSDNLCVQKDIVNEVALKVRAADGFILGSPTYYAGIAGTMKAFLDRMFYSSSRYFRYKVATMVSVVRRTGGLDVQHQLDNYLGLAGTITPPSQYWRVVYGREQGEALQDAEGIQTMRANARDMAWLLKTLDASKAIPKPETEKRVWTHFIR